MNGNNMDGFDFTNTGDKIPIKYFELPKQNRLREALIVFVLDLLQHDFHRLSNLLYRHDVSEKAIVSALSSGTIDEKAKHIADLIIDREMQKVATRKAYREFKSNQKNWLDQ